MLEVTNGFQKCSDNYFFNSTCKNECIDGYQIASGSTSKCTENGTWTNLPVLCSR